MLVGDHETTGGDQPDRLALVESPFPMPAKQSFLDIMATEAELPRPVERVERPDDGNRIGRGYASIQSHRPTFHRRLDVYPLG